MLGQTVLVPGAAGCVSVGGGGVREVEIVLGGKDVAIVVAVVGS